MGAGEALLSLIRLLLYNGNTFGRDKTVNSLYMGLEL